MEDEENKKVDTQTTEKADNSNETKSTETDSEEQKIEQETDNSVTEAFGNTAEKNKNEGEKVKKDKSVAKTNADGSITFKNQDELDGFINRMYSKGAKSAEQKVSETKEENNLNTEQDTEEDNKEQQEKTTADIENIRAEIALEMIDADINAKKVRRAARLVDISKVAENGVLDKAKLKAEIDEIVAEWPELKNEGAMQEGKKGFAFGGSQGDMSSNSEDTEISKIFGNSKDD